MNDNSFTTLLRLIDQGKLSEIEAERLLNAVARLDSGVPTGTTRDPKNTHTHTI